MPKRKSNYEYLSRKWAVRNKNLQKNLWEKHKNAFAWVSDKSKKLAIGSVGGLMLLASPATQADSLKQLPMTLQQEFTKNIDKNVFLVYDLSHVLPEKVRILTSSEEDVIAQVLTRHFGFRVTPELEGKRLNRSYGYIGAEQHLSRFPGDTMSTHLDAKEEVEKFWSSGMAPGLGAWGYFAPSQTKLTEKDKIREKYYIAVQTFLSPGFNNHVKEYVDFFKYRKMLVVNPDNGKAVVAVIADAGPAEWTGKHLGGSPEVMNYLERFDGTLRGPVLYFFIDDPDDKISLGPIAVQ